MLTLEFLARLDDKTISHSILDEAIESNSEFVIADTGQSLNFGEVFEARDKVLTLLKSDNAVTHR